MTFCQAYISGENPHTYGGSGQKSWDTRKKKNFLCDA